LVDWVGEREGLVEFVGDLVVFDLQEFDELFGCIAQPARHGFQEAPQDFDSDPLFFSQELDKAFAIDGE
jgi:hypothetical protein